MLLFVKRTVETEKITLHVYHSNDILPTFDNEGISKVCQVVMGRAVTNDNTNPSRISHYERQPNCSDDPLVISLSCQHRDIWPRYQ